MALARPAYRPRDAERSVLHTVVRAHLDTFLREAPHRADDFGEDAKMDIRANMAHGSPLLECSQRGGQAGCYTIVSHINQIGRYPAQDLAWQLSC